MSEFLTVRLSSEPQSPVPWCVWSTSQQEVIASGELASWQQLDELTPYAQQRSCIALLSGSDCLVTEVEIPKGAARQFESMLPYLLEDEVAQDVDDLHFTVLDKSATSAVVCGVEKQWLSNIVAVFKEQGITFRKILPDTFALPIEEQGVTALQLDSQWLLRKSEFKVASVDDSWLGLFSRSDWFDSEDDETLMVYSYTGLPSESAMENQSVDWQVKPAELVMALLSQHAITSSVNLLTGSFKAKSSFLKYWRIWQKVAVAACLLLAVLVVQKVLLVQQYETQASAYRAESERIFRTVFPNKRKIPTVSYLKRQMNDEASRLGGSSGEDSMLHWLSHLPLTLGKVAAIELESIKYDGNRSEVRIQAKSADFQSFEDARTKLSEQFVVEQGPLNRNGEAVFGSFVLKRK
ncbi:type II secretion system protein GspL [Vibrio sp. T187]|uniref:type II secretion system protein GspL n=1 Tax=Vibrio TaxID=662 RepID=UPI0010C9FB6F|nr:MULTISPECIES: type II secretion system protein GspL [Vibrio]MBW3697642.1 type II secretion system protein GspL [Vibrio sp. T187]